MLPREVTIPQNDKNTKETNGLVPLSQCQRGLRAPVPPPGTVATVVRAWSAEAVTLAPSSISRPLETGPRLTSPAPHGCDSQHSGFSRAPSFAVFSFCGRLLESEPELRKNCVTHRQGNGRRFAMHSDRGGSLAVFQERFILSTPRTWRCSVLQISN